MAALRSHDSGTQVVLPDRCVVGRSRSCDLVLDARDVSGQHAALEWTGSHWELHDLDSRNGTYLGGGRLAAGTRAMLKAGDQIRFGREAPAFELVDVGGPQVMALHLGSHQWRLGEGGYLALPESQHPECCVYQDPGGVWVSETGGDVAPVTDRDVMSLPAGDLWRLYLPRSCPRTWQDDDAPLLVANLRLCFAVSRDEEHVELVAHCGEHRLDLQVRAHHYPLLLLARRRLADARAGVPGPEQGWIRQRELLTMLRMDDNHLNISIHRARTQLGKLGVADAASLVERRANSRQLRLGVGAVELRPLEP